MIVKINAKGAGKAKEAIEKCTKVLKRVEGNILNGQAVPFGPDFSCFRLFMRTALRYGLLREVEAPKKYDVSSGIWIKTNLPPQIEITGQSPRRKPTGGTKKQGDGTMMKPKFNHAISPPVLPQRNTPSRLALIGKIEDDGGYNVAHQLSKLQSLRERRA